MSTTKQKKRRSARPPADRETSASEALTVAWTVTVTTLVFCDLSIVALHLWIRSDPGAHNMAVLRDLLLLGGSIIGALSLVLVPLVYKVRRVPPPRGLAVFGMCVAVAPILAMLVRSLE